MQDNKFYKYKHILGLGVIEIILAVAVMMIITPAVLKYSFKELFEVKYINVAKQLKKIEKSLLNYASIEKQKWGNNATGQIVSGVREKFETDYGLETDIARELTDNLKVKYKKNSAGEVVVYGVLDMSDLNFDEMAFKQTLLYAGDTAGYREDNFAYSITGAWSESMSDIMPNAVGDRIVVIRIDDTNLENEYSSSNYLYRNNQGGAEGNRMNVDLKLGDNAGYSINNFGTIDVANVYSSATSDSKVSELRFNNGDIKGTSHINKNAVLKGKISFLSGANIRTKLFEIAYLENGSSFVTSVLKELIVPNAVLGNSSSGISSSRANIIVNGLAILSNLSVKNMQFSLLTGYNGANTPLTIKPFNLSEYSDNKSKLHLEISANEIDDLSVYTMTVKNGFLESSNRGFYVASNNGFVWVRPSANVIIQDVCHRVGYCDTMTLKNYNLSGFMNTFSNSLNDLSREIDKLK